MIQIHWDFGSVETDLSFTISNAGNGELNLVSDSKTKVGLQQILTSGSLTNNSEDVNVTVE